MKAIFTAKKCDAAHREVRSGEAQTQLLWRWNVGMSKSTIRVIAKVVNMDQWSVCADELMNWTENYVESKDDLYSNHFQESGQIVW